MMAIWYDSTSDFLNTDICACRLLTLNYRVANTKLATPYVWTCEWQVQEFWDVLEQMHAHDLVDATPFDFNEFKRVTRSQEHLP